jgi:hypothetical protein
MSPDLNLLCQGVAIDLERNELIDSQWHRPPEVRRDGTGGLRGAGFRGVPLQDKGTGEPKIGSRRGGAVSHHTVVVQNFLELCGCGDGIIDLEKANLFRLAAAGHQQAIFFQREKCSGTCA